MKNISITVCMILLLFSCKEKLHKKIIYVNDSTELNKVIAKVVPGDEIVLKNGVWNNVEINFYALGTKENPITLRAETAGKVFIEGASYLHLGGNYLIVDGLYFKNGYTPKSSVIRYMIDEDITATNCRVTNTVIENFTKPNRLTNDHWIEFYGKNNQLDHCYISGKSNDGETLRIFFTGNKHINSHHQITNNYFGPRPRKGGPRAETIRVGDSKTRFVPGYVNVSDNYFEACNGEVEIISDKTNFNSYKNNIFYKCEGSLVLRHGSYATVDGNIFIGGDDSDFYGGIRVVNAGHWITNNYFYKIKGEAFRSPLAIMNGIPMTPLNRYLQVSDAVIAYNTWVDCVSPWQIGVGQNLKSADVLPISEIRSAPPIRSTVANNIIYNTQEDKTPVVNHSEMGGILFKNNLIDNNGAEYTEYNVLENASLKMKKINEWLYAPEASNNKVMAEVFDGYDFNTIQKDIFGAPRTQNISVGAISNLVSAKNFKIEKKNYGPDWFSTEKIADEPKIVTALTTEGDLIQKIDQASSGDIIELTGELYTIKNALKIDKDITIRSKDSLNKATVVFEITNDSVAFSMHPRGNLRLENLIVKGNTNTIAFSPLEENMSSAYNLLVNNCTIEGFDFVLKATKGSFADSISFKNSTISNCKNGIVLASEERGDYNAEMVSFKQCEFINVQNNVINFYRGGYDESTIGGILTVANNTFNNCGKNETEAILLKTRGIINVEITDNTFKNNTPKFVAVLWGEKNNHHSNNILVNSGKIKVEDQQKLKILY
jgi:poly(beta-D-mannuronate) lyase